MTLVGIRLLEPFGADSSPIDMRRATLKLRPKTDADRIRRLFEPSIEEVERLALIARLELETRFYSAGRAQA